jgi:5-oxoprolinase (ATP-hydrolysing) subunit A
MPISLNIDLGELDEEPDELVGLATIANVACGGHAGDTRSMHRVLRLARDSGTSIAAHPSYEDREGFGRRSRFQSARDAALAVGRQCGELEAVASELGLRVRFLKLHGALYHDAARDHELGRIVVDAARTVLPDLEAVIGPAGSELERVALERGLRFEREALADRGYDERGRLLARGTPNALLDRIDDVIAQATRFARAGEHDTLCLHGDTPGALERACAVRSHLEREGLLWTGESTR